MPVLRASIFREIRMRSFSLLHEGYGMTVRLHSRFAETATRAGQAGACASAEGPATGPRQPLAAILRFVGATCGTTAVEFAIVAAPFIALLMAILQVGVVFFAQQVLQTATNQAARLIMTGQAQTGNMTAAQFQQTICTDATSLFNCSGIFVNVQTFSTFSGVSMTNPVQNGTFSNSNLQYTPGGSGDIVVAQVFYQWPVYLGPLGFNISNLNNNKLLLVGTAAFRNEP
jgi:Flp pilus assembly protein TadG